MLMIVVSSYTDKFSVKRIHDLFIRQWTNWPYRCLSVGKRNLFSSWKGLLGTKSSGDWVETQLYIIHIPTSDPPTLSGSHSSPSYPTSQTLCTHPSALLSAVHFLVVPVSANNAQTVMLLCSSSFYTNLIILWPTMTLVFTVQPCFWMLLHTMSCWSQASPEVYVAKVWI